MLFKQIRALDFRGQVYILAICSKGIIKANGMWVWVISHRKTHKTKVLKSWWECECNIRKQSTGLPSYSLKLRAVYKSYSEAEKMISSLLIIDYEDMISLFPSPIPCCLFPFLFTRQLMLKLVEKNSPED